MDDKADVAARVTVPATHKALVHENGVSAARGHVVDGVAHVHQAFNRADGHAVVHGNNDGTAICAVDDTFQADFFSKVHGLAPFSLLL